MASAPDVLRTSRYYFIIALVLHVAASALGDLLSVSDAQCSDGRCGYVVRVPLGSSWRLTQAPGARGDICDPLGLEYEIRELMEPSVVNEGDGRIEVTVPERSGRLYFCRREQSQQLPAGRWLHQGTDVFLDSRVVLGVNLDASVDQFQSVLRAASSSPNDAVQTNLDLMEETHAAEGPSTVSEAAGEINTIEVKNSLINKGTGWQDLTRDIDVNNELGGPQLTREEANDILVLTDAQSDQYVNLSGANMNLSNLVIDADSAKNRTGNYTVDENINVEMSNIKQELSTSDKGLVSQESIVVDIETINQIDVSEIEKPVVIRETREISEEPFNVTTERSEVTAAALRSERRNDQMSLVYTDNKNVKIEGIRIERSSKPPEIDDGVPSVLASTEVTIRVFGIGITENTLIGFTHEKGAFSSTCKYRLKGEYTVNKGSVHPDGTTAEITFVAPEPIGSDTFYICARNTQQQLTTNPDLDSTIFIHQGSSRWVTLRTHNRPLPLWAMLTLISVCLMFSALFSGLNLGLMSLDRTELKIIANTGTDAEKRYARAIQPVRDHGNFLLCSILLGNVAVNSTFTILLDDLMPGLLAVVMATLLIVCLGEIVPQAICSRHGLMIGARTIVITKAVMGLTAPLAYPVSRILDYCLGEEIGNVYNRERLKELVKVTNDINDLDKDEVNIISGALELRKKTVIEVMTRIEDVFMLSSDSVLDFETMSEIVKSGFSRIPVYEGTRTNIVTVLFIKDLAFVDPDDNTPLRTLCQFYQNPCNFVFEDTTLDVMFRQFKEGHKGHMAFVHRVNNEGEGDPFYETVGLVTLEDVIEELIQAEIVDETDVFTDNRSKRRRNRPVNKLQDFAAFAERRENQRIRISPQLTLAAFQFLASTVDAFRPDVVSETVLRRLLRQDIIHQIKCKGKDKQDPSTLVYTQGKPADYFVLILEGRVEVTVGRENLVFEAGPFTYFGVQALTQNVGVQESPTPSAMGSLQNINMDAMLRYTFIPDYSVRAITELFYITIKRSLYLAAKRATLMEKTSSLTKGGASVGEQFDSEVDKATTSAEGAGRRYVARKFLQQRGSREWRSNPGAGPLEADPQKQTRKAHFCNSQESISDESRWSGAQELTAPFVRSSSEDLRPDEPAPVSRSGPGRSLEEKLFDLELERIGVENERLEAENGRIEMESEVLVLLRMILSALGGGKEALLQSLDEDASIAGDQRTPSRQLSPNLPPVSASHQTRSAFTSAAGSPPRAPANNGDVTYKFPPCRQIETDDK